MRQSPHNTYNFVTKSKEERDSWMSQVLKELAKLTKHQGSCHPLTYPLTRSFILSLTAIVIVIDRQCLAWPCQS